MQLQEGLILGTVDKSILIPTAQWTSPGVQSKDHLMNNNRKEKWPHWRKSGGTCAPFTLISCTPGPASSWQQASSDHVRSAYFLLYLPRI